MTYNPQLSRVWLVWRPVQTDDRNTSVTRNCVMKKQPLAFALVAVFVLAAGAVCADELQQRANSMFKAIPKYPPAIDGNEITAAKVELGKMLFFEPRLSASHLISCNTCHNVGMGGHDYLPVSIGHGWQKGPRNSPTVFNAVFNAAQFWDGRAADLAEQAKGPIQAGVEMGSTPRPDEMTSTTAHCLHGDKRRRASRAFLDSTSAISVYRATWFKLPLRWELA
ncbi:cytochrome-c peroxidase [Pseudohalioglobus lutimaris]|uniref:cytochrome-c peroxidase n=1 Tax=Pseudohalioglobus lutimaris TaxID=1737061 RepID=UPI0024344A99|nr:cytochrome-c peroxidase [Pseudohalioglobus lutimaris]